MKILNHKGQTLLEVLIAISILVVVLVTTISLIVASIKAGRESTNKLIGTSLAREAIEVARNIRDSNWAATATLDWDSGLASGADNTFAPVIPPANSTSPLSMDPTPDSFTAVQYTAIKQFGTEYVQGSSTTGSDTLFFRLVYLNPICQKDTGEELIAGQTEQATCGLVSTTVQDYPNKVGIRVIAEVRWPAASSTKHVIIEDRLYNWQVL